MYTIFENLAEYLFKMQFFHTRTSSMCRLKNSNKYVLHKVCIERTIKASILTECTGSRFYQEI